MTEHSRSEIDLSLNGFTVSQCIIDRAFTLRMLRPLQSDPNQEGNSLRIEAPFDFEMEGVTHHCDLEHDLQTACPALALLWRVVEAAHVNGQGGLQITFSGGVVIRVPSDPNFEAWTLNSSNGLIVSGPGGEISTFSSADGFTHR